MNAVEKSIIPWPIEYRIRQSDRAKRVLLRIQRSGEVEVVIPNRLKSFNVAKFVEESKQWILQKLSEFQVNTQSLLTEMPQELPLLAIEQTWKIFKTLSEYTGVKVKSKHFLELTLMGEVDDDMACRLAMRQWLQKKAKKILPPWFEEVSARFNLPFKDLKINVAKTRWGSCSPQKNINLNAKLLLLPPSLVEHVMLHELCHTVHLNHSRDFWRLLAKYDPLASTHRVHLRNYQSPVTLWLEKG